MHRRLIAVCFVATVALAAAACGSNSNTTQTASTGGSSSSTAGSSAPASTTAGSTPGSQASGPKADYIQKADAICTDAAKQSSSLAVDLGSTNTADVNKEADAIDQSVMISQHAIDQLKALPAPPGEEATVSGFWDALAAQVPTQQQIATDIRNNDLQGAQTATQQAKQAGQQIDAKLAAYGFVACAK